MYKFISLIFFSLLCSKILNAEIIKKIEITGNQRVSDETIIIYGEVNKNQDYSENDLNKILGNLYSTNFFEDVRVNLLNGVLQIILREYPVINELVILGEPSKKYNEQIKNIIRSKQKF